VGTVERFDGGPRGAVGKRAEPQRPVVAKLRRTDARRFSRPQDAAAALLLARSLCCRGTWRRDRSVRPRPARPTGDQARSLGRSPLAVSRLASWHEIGYVKLVTCCLWPQDPAERRAGSRLWARSRGPLGRTSIRRDLRGARIWDRTRRASPSSPRASLPDAGHARRQNGIWLRPRRPVAALLSAALRDEENGF
jgi:hypothetical protein